ncbi:4-deoxy-L-threo-5-hexosulose-uronate ketol-isomerase [Nonlabens ulvanivorans]|nr:4-deoxy-L-threo-5-hexosulose-uronate ketol-isomerase [Nonlabens ulvanivorans]
MSTKFETRYANSPETVKAYNTTQLRDEFLIDKPMVDGEINLVYTHYDRYIAGGAVPTKPLKLESIDPLKAEHFLDRREMGIINVGAAGKIEIDGTTYELAHKDALYIGMGAKNVVFHSVNNSDPAKFYINSAPAHQSYPTKKQALPKLIKSN